MTQQSGQPDFSPEHFFRRPDIYLLEFTAKGGNLVPMTRDCYQQSIFTDRGRIVPASPGGWEIGMIDLLQGYENQGLEQPELGFVFHIAHCGSTLLARALDIADRTLVYREPFTLRQLAVDAAWKPGGPKNQKIWQRQLRLTTGLLGRTYSSVQNVIIKTNVPVNFIIPQLMGLADGNRGILLYAGLERYLLSVLKSPMHQKWVMNVLSHVAGGVTKTNPLAELVLEGITPPQAAASLWLAQMYRFEEALADFPRLRSLDCEDLFSRPADTVAAAFGHLGVRMSAGEVADIVASDLFARHAKNPDRAYDSATREAELQQLKRQLAAELAAGMAWADEVMAQRKLSLPLMNPLLV
jgi:hypothetical protein